MKGQFYATTPNLKSPLEEMVDDTEELKLLCKELLDGADKCSQEPYYIVQPFLGIVKRHAKIIEKYNLLD